MIRKSVKEKVTPKCVFFYTTVKPVQYTANLTIKVLFNPSGNPQPEVKWFKEGDTVKAGERITLQTEDDIFTLEINDANPDDGGTYTLTAHNSEGTIFSDVLVTVSIPPSIGPADDEIRYVSC